MFKQYIKYIKDNPKGYWFKRKLFGWGWVPATREGWLVVLGLIGVIAYAAKQFLTNNQPLRYFITLGIAAAIVIIIGYAKGEKPKWQWGLPREDQETYGDKK